MTKRAVTYARVSSNDKAKTGGENLADQTRLCREYAIERGYQIVAELAEDDRGASGATFDLPQLAKALDMARSDRYDILIVRELDRLSRSLAKQLIVEQELKHAGVTIEYVLYDFPSTPEGRLNKNLRAMLAEYEREKIKQRMMRGKLREVRAGTIMTGGRAPFGYRNITVDGKNQLEIAEDEAEIVRLIFQWYTEGDGENGPLGMQAIRQKLTDMRVPTYVDRRKANPGAAEKTPERYGVWCVASVSNILGSETHCGIWYYGKRNGERENVSVEVPAIISRETWEIAQARRAKNQRYARRNLKYDYLLRQRLTCGECKRKMTVAALKKTGRGEKRYLYYRCVAKCSGFDCTMTKMFTASYVDTAAWEWVRGLLTDIEGLESSLRKYQADREKQVQPLRENLAAIATVTADYEKKLQKVLDLYLDGHISKEDYLGRKQHYENVLADAKEEQTRKLAMLETESLSEEQLQSVIQFAQVIAEEVEEADQDFETRCEIIEALQVRGELGIEDGEKVLHLHCILGETDLLIGSTPFESHKYHISVPAT